jgi:hypothetical protein
LGQHRTERIHDLVNVSSGCQLNHNINAWEGRSMLAKRFSYNPFDAISIHGSLEMAFSHYEPKPRAISVVTNHEYAKGA